VAIREGNAIGGRLRELALPGVSGREAVSTEPSESLMLWQPCLTGVTGEFCFRGRTDELVDERPRGVTGARSGISGTAAAPRRIFRPRRSRAAAGLSGKDDAEKKRLTGGSGVVSWKPWTLVVERDGFALDEQGIR